MVTKLLLFITLAPIILGLIGFFLPNLLKKVFGVILLIGNLGIAILLFTYPALDTSLLKLDAFARLIVLFVCILGLLIYIYTLRNTSPDHEGKSLLLILLSIGLSVGVVVSGQMISFVIFWGISGLMLYFYALFNQTPAGGNAAKKTFLMIGGSDVLLIIGFAIIWFNHQESFQLYATSLKIGDFWSSLAFVCLLLAALTKAGGFPMHTWVPVFAENSPIEGVAILPASLDKLLGIFLLTRMLNGIFEVPLILNLIVMIIGAITIITAVMMALIQHNGRKLLGYHAVSQVGYMILGLGTANLVGIIGGIFHLINHTLYKSNLFLSFGSVEKRTGTAELDKMGGLAVNMPWTFISSLVGALAISGLPPFNGFVSKWLIYQSLVMGAQGKPFGLQIIYIFCLIIAVFGSGLTLASFMKFLYTVYFGKNNPNSKQVTEISPNNWWVTITLSALCLLLGIFAFPFMINGLLGPALGGNMEISNMVPGFYQPYLMVSFFTIGLVIAFLGYLVFRKVRFARNYVGGQEDTDLFTVNGTHFYNDIRFMNPLKTIYDLALKKAFDIYDWTGKLVQSIGVLIQKSHTGILTTYATWVIVGFILVMLMLLGQ
jgi:formate hydrogenlyase subunit 3/multisubunit Na+/H+ antiporter MnhD subunit